jgi:DNA-binding MarR family transcriptional regulator
MVDDADKGALSPLSEVLGHQLRRAHMLFAEHWQLSFRDRQGRVTPMQGGMLMSIESRPGMTQAALARLMDVEGPTLLQALEKLEQAGLVQRSRHAGDRRSFALYLTTAGQHAVSIVKHYVPYREAALLTDLSDEERALLLDLLKRVVRRGRTVVSHIETPFELSEEVDQGVSTP